MGEEERGRIVCVARSPGVASGIALENFGARLVSGSSTHSELPLSSTPSPRVPSPSFLPFHFPDLYLYTCLCLREPSQTVSMTRADIRALFAIVSSSKTIRISTLTLDKRLSAQFLPRLYFQLSPRGRDAFLPFLPRISKIPDCIRIFFSFSTSSPFLSLSLSFVIPIGARYIYIYTRLEPSHRRFMNSVVKAPLSEHGGTVAPFVGYVQFVSFSQFANTPFTLLLARTHSYLHVHAIV